jgi:hypothetical protein
MPLPIHKIQLATYCSYDNYKLYTQEKCIMN